LLCYAQYFQKFGDVKAGLSIYEMKNAVVRAAEADFDEQGIGIAGKIPVSEEQELNETEMRASSMTFRRVFARS
jgi:hypothetical protein